MTSSKSNGSFILTIAQMFFIKGKCINILSIHAPRGLQLPNHNVAEVS